MPESEVSITMDCPEPSMYLRLVVASKMIGASLMPVIVIVSSAFCVVGVIGDGVCEDVGC